MGSRFWDVVSLLREMDDGELLEVYRYIGTKLVSRKRLSDYYICAMNEILGVDVRRRTRLRQVLWGRFIVIYELLCHGWTTKMAGAAFGLDHSTVVNARKQVRNMLEMPWMYTDEIDIYKEFKRRISDGRMCMEGEA